jgi:hypothetical protein
MFSDERLLQTVAQAYTTAFAAVAAWLTGVLVVVVQLLGLLPARKPA